MPLAFPISHYSINPRQYPGLVFWVDAKDPAANGTQPSNGSALATWKDKSGNGYDATQASGAAQPIFTTNAINTLPVIRFNGTTQFVKVANTALAAKLTGNISIFFVHQTPTVTSFPTIFCTDPTPAAPRFDLNMPFNANTIVYDAGGVAPGRITGAWGGSANTPYIWTFNASIAGNTQTAYRSLTSVISGNTPQTTTFSGYKFTLGALDTETSATDFMQGDIGEFIMYNTFLTNAQRINIYHYLSSKWKIT